MKINNIPVNQNLSLKSKFLTKEVKTAIVKDVDKFLQETTKDRGHKEVERFGSALLYPVSLLFGLVGPLAAKNFGVQDACFLVFAVNLRNACITIHNLAVENSVNLVKDLQEKGLGHKERLFGVKKYLQKDGCPLFSTIFKAVKRKDLNDLADGILNPQAFPSYKTNKWREKYQKRYLK